jgi:hypothetical protein
MKLLANFWHSLPPFVKGMMFMLLIVTLTTGSILIYRSCSKVSSTPSKTSQDTTLNHIYQEKIKGFELIIVHKDSANSILKRANAVLVAELVRRQIPVHYKPSDLPSINNLVAFQDSVNKLYQLESCYGIMAAIIINDTVIISSKDSIIKYWKKQSAKNLFNLKTCEHKVDSCNVIISKSPAIKPTWWKRAETDIGFFFGGIIGGIALMKL